jgi:cyclopropane-fatty-acyl-phospholipid synthase
MKPFVPFLRLLIRRGTLIVIDADEQRHTFGDQSPTSETVTMRLHDPELHWKLVTHPSLAIGEGFMDGTLTLENGTTLYQLLTVLMGNQAASNGRGILGVLDSISRAFGRWMAFNPIKRAQRNVAHHYDLGDPLFDLFLDSDRQYSCAYFADPSDSLEQAQANKKSLIARKLLLSPGLKVLDIGSGWGGLGLSLAGTYGADVTGITLSREQLATSNARAKAAGLDSRCRFLFRDYRHERGTFDRIVSVGMFEHVGLRHYGTFFKRIAKLLKDDGVALIHSIGMYARPGPAPEWIKKYIFPGCYVPALSQVMPAVQNAGLKITDMEILRLHYAETLRHWRTRFLAKRAQAVEMYDERFCRMWEFYLTCCEVSFRIEDLMVFQLQVAHHQTAVPLTRDYLLGDGIRTESGDTPAWTPPKQPPVTYH